MHCITNKINFVKKGKLKTLKRVGNFKIIFMKHFLSIGLIALMLIFTSCNTDETVTQTSELQMKEKGTELPPAIAFIIEGEVPLFYDAVTYEPVTKWTVCPGSFFSGPGGFGYRMSDGTRFIQVTMSYHKPFTKDPWNSTGYGLWGGAWAWWMTEWVGSC